MKHWSALLPLALSLVGLVLIFGHVAASGAGPEADEGTLARLWWLVMAAQVPLVAFYAITWLPRAPQVATWIVILQVAAVLANLAAVRFFNL